MIVMARVLAEKAHSCDVGRLIRSCNLMKTPSRNSLNIKTQNLHLYIYCNMSLIDQFDPRPLFNEWLKRMERRAKETLIAREQRWWRGIFKDANNAEDNEDERDEEDSDKPQNHRIKHVYSEAKNF